MCVGVFVCLFDNAVCFLVFVFVLLLFVCLFVFTVSRSVKL